MTDDDLKDLIEKEFAIDAGEPVETAKSKRKPKKEKVQKNEPFEEIADDTFSLDPDPLVELSTPLSENDNNLSAPIDENPFLSDINLDIGPSPEEIAMEKMQLDTERAREETPKVYKKSSIDDFDLGFTDDIAFKPFDDDAALANPVTQPTAEFAANSADFSTELGLFDTPEFATNPETLKPAQSRPINQPEKSTSIKHTTPSPAQKIKASSSPELEINEPNMDDDIFDNSKTSAYSSSSTDTLDDEELIDVSRLEFPSLEEQIAGKRFDIDMFVNIPVKITVELGDATISLKDIYALSEGSIIELDKITGELLPVKVNDQTVALGEVVVVDQHYGIRIKEIVSVK